jgi:hypothetical protein
MDVALICWVFVQRSLDAQVFANKRQTVIFLIHLEILPPCHAQVLVTMVPLSSASLNSFQTLLLLRMTSLMLDFVLIKLMDVPILWQTCRRP